MRVTIWSKVEPLVLAAGIVAGFAIGMLLFTWAWAWILYLASKLLPWPN